MQFQAFFAFLPSTLNNPQCLAMGITANSMASMNCSQGYGPISFVPVWGWICYGNLGQQLIKLQILLANTSDPYENTYQKLDFAYPVYNQDSYISYISSNASWYSQSAYVSAMSHSWGNDGAVIVSFNLSENGTSINTTGCCIPESTTIAFVPNTSNITINFNVGSAQSTTWCQNINISSNVSYTTAPDVTEGGDVTSWTGLVRGSSHSSIFGLQYNVTNKSLIIIFAYIPQNPAFLLSQCAYTMTGNGGGSTGNEGDILSLTFILFIFSVMSLLF
jgi:hypothetical protein